MLTLTMPNTTTSGALGASAHTESLAPEAMGDAAADVLEAGRPQTVEAASDCCPATAEATSANQAATPIATPMTQSQWHANHTEQVEQAESHCQECEDEYEESAEETKTLKKRLDGAISALRVIARDTYSDYLTRKAAQEAAAKAAAAAAAEGSNAVADESTDGTNTSENVTAGTAAATVSDNAWRSVDILELANCDLSPAIAQKLKDAEIETIGQLEDLRGEISLGRAKWPKGIGEKKITAIEDAVSKFLFRGVGGTEHVPVTPVLEESSDGATPIDETPSNWWDLSPDDRYQRLLARMNELGTESETDPVALAEKMSGCGYWQQGYDANTGDGNLEDKIGFAPSPAQDDWLRGYMSRTEGKHRERREASNPAESPTAEPAANASPGLVDIDDL